MEQSQLYNSQYDDSPNTDEQRHIFDEIADNIILQGTTGLCFVQVIGGSGKSTFYNKNWLRREHQENWLRREHQENCAFVALAQE